MNKSTLGAFPFLKPSLQKNPRLHTAVVLCPAEVEVEFKDYPAIVRQKLRDHWMLIGAVNENTSSAFKANAGDDIVAKMTVFPTSAGAFYGVLICQVGAHQHRFVLPLFAPEVVKFLAFATKASINIYLESADELREGMLYDCPMSPEAFIPVQRISQVNDQCHSLSLRCWVRSRSLRETGHHPSRTTIEHWWHRVAMSGWSLARLVQRETGMSFGRWRQQLHLLVVLRQLSEGRAVQEVAGSLGNDSVTASITMFKKALGQPPGWYFNTLR